MDACGDLRTSPVLVISVYSSDSDPDSADDDYPSCPPSDSGSPSSASFSDCVVESPSHYATASEHVVLSVVSNVVI